MISGMYMGELVRVMLVHLADHGVLFENVNYRPLKVPHSFPTKYVSEIEGFVALCIRCIFRITKGLIVYRWLCQFLPLNMANLDDPSNIVY